VLAPNVRNGICRWCDNPLDDHAGVMADALVCPPRVKAAA